MDNWFIGLPLAAGAWFEALEPPPGARLFHPEDLHITVAFLGRVGEDAARRAFAFAPAWPSPALSVSLGPMVPLGHPRRFSALSALLEEGRAQVEAAMARVRDVMADAAGAEREHRPPLAHVTLARPSRKADAEQRRGMLAWASATELRAPRVLLSALTLYTRAERSEARSYRAVDTHWLSRAD